MISHIIRNVTTIEKGVICHGVNCQGKMGAGVAKAIKTRWPEVYKSYKTFTKSMKNKDDLLGICHSINVSPDNTLFVANCYTQVNYGKKGRFASPVAVNESLQMAYKLANEFSLDIYMPTIGCGLGGLDWDDEVNPIIEKFDLQWKEVDTYVCTLD